MQIDFRASFEKDILDIKDEKILSKIYSTIAHIEDTPDIASISNIKKLKGHKNYYRIRLGDFRLGLVYENRILIFVRFLHRKDIYKYFP